MQTGASGQKFAHCRLSLTSCPRHIIFEMYVPAPSPEVGSAQSLETLQPQAQDMCSGGIDMLGAPSASPACHGWSIIPRKPRLAATCVDAQGSERPQLRCLTGKDLVSILDASPCLQGCEATHGIIALSRSTLNGRSRRGCPCGHTCYFNQLRQGKSIIIESFQMIDHIHGQEWLVYYNTAF